MLLKAWRVLQLTINMSSHCFSVHHMLTANLCLFRKRLFHVVVKLLFSLWEETLDLINGGRY